MSYPITPLYDSNGNKLSEASFNRLQVGDTVFRMVKGKLVAGQVVSRSPLNISTLAPGGSKGKKAVNVAVIDRTTKKRFAAGQIALICQGLTQHFAQQVTKGLGLPAWKIAHYPSGILPKGVTQVMYLLDSSDTTGAGAEHDKNSKGVPEAKVFVEDCVKAGYSINDGPQSISAVMDHELKEMAFDPNCSSWYSMGGGNQMAGEVCDPVQGQGNFVMVRGQKVWCSDFVYSSYFDPNGKAPFNWCGGITAPFQTLPTGFFIKKDARGNITPVYGTQFPKAGWNHIKARLKSRAG